MQGCAVRISGYRAVLSGSQGEGLLSGSQGEGLLSGSQGEGFLSGSRGARLVGLGPSGTPVFVSSQAPRFPCVWADGSSYSSR